MYIVKFKTKYGSVYYTSDDFDKIFDKVLKERIDDGCWYLDEEEAKAKAALESGKSLNFLSLRKDCEYEGFEIIYPTHVD
jgi:hypothetical protein